MIKSMTGYGKSFFENEEENISVEIRTLNSKQQDIILKIPAIFKEKELEIRNLVSKTLVRGKVEVFVNYQSHKPTGAPELNRDLALHYYRQMKPVWDEINEGQQPDYMALILKMPDVLVPVEVSPDESSWQLLLTALDAALKKVDDFRLHEGKVLEKDFRKRVETILRLLDKVNPFEKERIERIRERIKKHAKEYLDGTGIDPDRLEQEMIYYIEKLDITEEKIRLKKHCDYFLQILDSTESSGKKLAFISQEIGREINTLGSKANDAGLQRIVVLMKEELEKIKEQLFNIL